AVVSDGLGNWGRAMFQLDTTLDTWNYLPQVVPLGTVVIRSGAPVGSSYMEYYGDGHTRNTTHLVMFRCTQSGDKGTSEPWQFAWYGLANVGQEVPAWMDPMDPNKIPAKWTVESVPKDYENGTPYVAGQRVVLPGDNDHVFECLEAGTSRTLA